MAESIVTSEGQITIPKSVRDRLHLQPGDKVYFNVQNDGAVTVTCEHPVEALFGLLKSKVHLKRPITIAEMNPTSR